MDVLCPGCDARLSVPDGSAGKRGRCRKCNLTFEVPGASAEPAVADDVMPRISTAETGSTVRLRSGPGREPWYYGFLFGYAYFNIILGVGAFLIWTSIVLLGVARANADKLEPAGSVLMILLMLAWPFAWLTGVLVIGCCVLIYVDQARNVRRIER